MDLGCVEFVFLEAGEFDAEAWLQGVRIGYVHATRESDHLHIADIKVEESIPKWRISRLYRLLGSFGLRPNLSLRGRKIGSDLLRFVLQAADSAGIKKTWGCVAPEDCHPRLLAWYERHGFAIEPPDDDCVHKAVCKIVRRR